MRLINYLINKQISSDSLHHLITVEDEAKKNKWNEEKIAENSGSNF